MIDLHCHSYYSDGQLSPAELVKMAAERGVKLLALTDHDSVDGVMEMHEEGRKHGIQIINGVELSVNWKKKEIHVLGLNIDVSDESLTNALSRQSDSRINRAREICARLSFTKIERLFEKANERAQNGVITRPHIAEVLLDEGVCKTMQDAFKRYLGRGKVGFVATQWLSLEEAVDVIVSSGGSAVIAHPLQYKLSATQMKALIEQFKSYGGGALEVVSGLMLANQIRQVQTMCDKYGLMASSGSDFHSTSRSRVSVGGQAMLPEGARPVWSQWHSHKELP